MNELYHRYSKALRDAPAPALWLDLEAFESNIQWALANANGKTIRVATKSIRSLPVLKQVLAASPVFQGLMTFTLAESLWLRSQGLKDILLGYPTADHAGLTELARDSREITLMVDLPEHLEQLKKYSGTFNICLDVDLSLDLPGVRFGVYRSAINSLERLELMLTAVKATPNVKLVGLMGYEAQVAGVMDKHSLLMRVLKRISIRKLRRRRESMCQLVQRHGFELRFVNGGGTGSLRSTGAENVVTEITVGSGFFAPVLFDNYEAFRLTPAMGFSLPIVRKPAPGMVTCLGGGYIASGSMELLKTPSPYLPVGLKLEKNEGTGEVQTPLYYTGELDLQIGDLVFMRHAKAGEPCERFNQIHLIRGDQLIGQAATYRGEGQAFL